MAKVNNKQEAIEAVQTIVKELEDILQFFKDNDIRDWKFVPCIANCSIYSRLNRAVNNVKDQVSDAQSTAQNIVTILETIKE
jgi:hypothetical protein